MNKIFKYMSVLFLISGLLVGTYAKENGNGRLRKVEADPSIYKFNVNNISTFIYADGRADVNGSNSGFEFPKGSNKYAVYESGFNWGGRLNGEVRFGGSTFPSGLVHGKIGQDPEASRMYRVRPDYATGSMLSEINDGEKSGDETAIRQQYRLDWDEWPVADGAPYFDADGDGVYTPDPDGNGTYDLGEDIPGVAGAHQTIFFIANAADGDKSRQFYGSPPQEIEMQTTVWGYTSVGPLGNMIFKKYNLFNRGDADYTDFYVGAWCDPDVGNAGDDFAGCDTVLSLGFAYNSSPTDSQYDDKPPASGHDFFQGPIVPSAGDTALVSGQLIPDWKNLGMTAYYYFVNENGTPYSDPDLDDYQTGTLYFYMLLQGRIGATGEYFPIPDELGGGVTKYPLSGDPVEGTGYLDGIIKPTDDRRYGMSSGPFTLAAGDNQEIVLAQLVAQGVNNIESVRLLKIYDEVAQQAYNDNFVLPSAPTPPVLTYSVFDQEIILMWDSDPTIVKATEEHDLKGYAFQGYNVYQLPTASSGIGDALKIATYDIIDGIKVITDGAKDNVTQADIVEVVQSGQDTGIKRNFRVTKDYINNADLFNGSRYYFAVTAYAYSADEFAVPNTLENVPVALTIVPQSAAPGVRLGGEYGDAIEVTHEGPSDGSVEVAVVDANALTGSSYEVSFREVTTTDDEGEESTEIVWDVDNTTTGARVLTAQTNQTGDDDYLVAEGLQVKVLGPPTGVNAIYETDANDELLDPRVGIIVPSLGTTGYIVDNRAGAANGAYGDRTFDRFLYWGMDDLIIDFSQTGLAWDYSSEEVQIDASTGLPYVCPFAIYRVKFSTGEHQRLFAGFWDTNADGVWSYNVDADGVPEWEGAYGPGYEPIYAWVGYEDDLVTERAYDPANEAAYAAASWLGDPAVANTTWGADVPIHYPYVTATIFVMYAADATPPWGNKVWFITNKPNTTQDSFTFTGPATTFSETVAKDDVAEQVNVFPNPYYGANSQELNKYQRFVTFSHLPQNAKIRIFNLAGQLVRTIDKTTNDQFQRWDLLNQQALPVASGIYIAYIDMPDIGTTKVLKLAIIQEQQILDRY